jgi:hypothetical protein
VDADVVLGALSIDELEAGRAEEERPKARRREKREV